MSKVFSPNIKAIINISSHCRAFDINSFIILSKMPDINTFYVVHLQVGHQNYYLTRFSVECCNSKKTDLYLIVPPLIISWNSLVILIN